MKIAAIAPIGVLAILAAFLPFVGGGLLTDDFVHLDRIGHGSSVASAVSVPDAFGFYRPLTQATLVVNNLVSEGSPAIFRLTNLAIHAAVVGMSFVVSRLVLGSVAAAWLAALAFALTSKAHPIAVLWISARGDLLMALFSLIATAAWIVWSREGRARWLSLAVTAYVLAFLSKETAVLLPVLLLVTPRAVRPLQQRVAAALTMAGAATVLLWWRTQVGALGPFSGDTHYDLSTPWWRWVRNANNYFLRMIPAPLALAMIAALAARGPGSSSSREPGTTGGGPVLIFGLAWTIALLLPVLPIEARSELYLYLPTFGLCLIAGWVAVRWIQQSKPAVAVACLAIYVLGFGAYQVSRSMAFHDDLAFSARLFEAIAMDAALDQKAETRLNVSASDGVVEVAPANEETRRFLQDVLGGYAVPVRTGSGDVRFRVMADYDEEPGAPGVIRLTCGYDGSRVSCNR